MPKAFIEHLSGDSMKALGFFYKNQRSYDRKEVWLNHVLQDCEGI